MNRKPGEPKGGADAQMALLATDFFFFFFYMFTQEGGGGREVVNYA